MKNRLKATWAYLIMWSFIKTNPDSGDLSQGFKDAAAILLMSGKRTAEKLRTYTEKHIATFGSSDYEEGILNALRSFDKLVAKEPEIDQAEIEKVIADLTVEIRHHTNLGADIEVETYTAALKLIKRLSEAAR